MNVSEIFCVFDLFAQMHILRVWLCHAKYMEVSVVYANLFIWTLILNCYGSLTKSMKRTFPIIILNLYSCSGSLTFHDWFCHLSKSHLLKASF